MPPACFPAWTVSQTGANSAGSPRMGGVRPFTHQEGQRAFSPRDGEVFGAKWAAPAGAAAVSTLQNIVDDHENGSGGASEAELHACRHRAHPPQTRPPRGLTWDGGSTGAASAEDRVPAAQAGCSQDSQYHVHAQNFVNSENTPQLGATNLGNMLSVRLLRGRYEDPTGRVPFALRGAVRRHTDGWEGVSSSTTAASAVFSPLHWPS